jgi:hypothetical protein
MGEGERSALRVDFDGQIRLEFHGANVTSDAGLLAYRELDETLGLTTEVKELGIHDPRTGHNTQHSVRAMVRQSVYSRLAGYEDTNDAERLCVYTAMRRVVGGRAAEKTAASRSQVGRFETQVLTDSDNLAKLMDLSGRWIDQVRRRKRMPEVILDLDSSVSPTHGGQEGSAYNGHFECTCYHPLFCFNQFGDLERTLLREGQVHSADDWRSVLEPVVSRYRGTKKRFFRGDAAFAKPELYEFLEAEGYQYAIHLPANDVLLEEIRYLLTRPVGRPPKKPIVYFTCFEYRAATWTKPRRVVAKVEWHRGELYPRVGFIVTNLTWSAGEVVAFYNQRGTAEQWIKEGKYALKWTRLSCCRFAANQVRLQLFALAYNLGSFLRRLALPPAVQHWSLTTLREKLIKIGAKIVRHARYVTFQMAEVAIPRKLFRAILQRIARLKMKSALPAPG